MTLSPVFRSSDAIESLRENGYLDILDPYIAAARTYQDQFYTLLDQVINERYINDARDTADDITFLQEHFFLILFDMAYENLGCPPQRRFIYGLLNLAVKGIITSADNLFDGEDKRALPLKLGKGQQFSAIMQLLCCDHSMMKILDKFGSEFEPQHITRLRIDLLSTLASIGELEGSEESGVDSILAVPDMIDRVHRVRGGKLFSLAFIAPGIFEHPESRRRWQVARSGFERLGTAFQIVDDIVDFEFDLSRKTHNILSAQLVHHGSAQERAAFKALQMNASNQSKVETTFMWSAQAVLGLACDEAKKAFEELSQIGFCFTPEDAEFFVCSIVGRNGAARIRAVATG